MQLTYPKAPSNGVQTLRPVLQAALQNQGFGINRQFANAAPAKVSLSEAYRGYSLTLDDLSQGKGLQDARIGDRHYLVFADGVTIADAQLAEVRGHVEFASLNHGDHAAATVAALKLAEQAPQRSVLAVLLQVRLVHRNQMHLPGLPVTRHNFLQLWRSSAIAHLNLSTELVA